MFLCAGELHGGAGLAADVLRGGARGHEAAGHSVRGGERRADLSHPSQQHPCYQAG